MPNPNLISFGKDRSDLSPRKSVNFSRNSAIISTSNQRRGTVNTTNSIVGRPTLAATRLSVLGENPTRKSILEQAEKQSNLDHTQRGSVRNSFFELSGQTSSKTSQFNTRNHSPFSNKKGAYVDDYDLTTAMRYGKIPERGGAKNPYSEHDPFPRAEITSDILKPGHREEWLKTLESKFVPKQLESAKRKKAGERSDERKSVLVTPIKDADNFFADKSTAMKTTTVKRTTTTNTKEMDYSARDNKPRTSEFDAGVSIFSTVKESQVVSNKVY